MTVDCRSHPPADQTVATVHCACVHQSQRPSLFCPLTNLCIRGFTTMRYIYRLFTRHSLVERRARYLVYCMFVCLFVRSTISRQPAGRITPKFACRRTLVPDVSSPLLGVGGPRRAEKGANEIFVTIGVNG